MFLALLRDKLKKQLKDLNRYKIFKFVNENIEPITKGCFYTLCDLVDNEFDNVNLKMFRQEIFESFLSK